MARRAFLAQRLDFERPEDSSAAIADTGLVAHGASGHAAVPDAMRSESRLRPHACIETELRLVTDSFREGDFHAALLSAMHALDAAPVPILCVTPTYLAKAELSNSERIVVALINGNVPLEEIIESSGLGLLEGIEAISELLDLGVIAFNPANVREPRTMPGSGRRR